MADPPPTAPEEDTDYRQSENDQRMNLTLLPLPRLATFAALLLGASGVQANLISVDYAFPMQAAL